MVTVTTIQVVIRSLQQDGSHCGKEAQALFAKAFAGTCMIMDRASGRTLRGARAIMRSARGMARVRGRYPVRQRAVAIIGSRGKA